MTENFTSKALEANLIQTRVSDIKIPEEQQWFIDISREKWGIHKRAEEFITELNHKFVNYQYVIEALHNISLSDLWFYNSYEESEKALMVLVNIFKELIDSDLTEEQRELLIKTIIKFMERLVNLSVFPHSIIWKCLDLIKADILIHENLYLFNSGYFKTYFNKIAIFPEYRDSLYQMTYGILDKCITFWEETTDVEAWLTERNITFDSIEPDMLQEIQKPFFNRLRGELQKCRQWDDLYNIMFFNDIANYYRSFTDRFGSSLEKIYYLHFLLHLPGMIHLKDHLLYDMNRYLRSVLEELNENDITSFIDKIMTLFEELKTDHAGTVLDLVLTIGKEIIRIKNDSITSYFVKCLIHLGFHYPGKVTMNSEWQIKINTNHVKNIRVWMELITYSPYEMRDLLAALIVNLKLGGIFISDTDLFQREVTKLLNSNIAPVYREMKQLARIFPVYFREIGAEGKLREITTAIDEISRRQDRLIHFLRKQTHTESNNTHIELTRQIILYWLDGNKSRLKDMIPDDVYEWLDVKSEWFVKPNKIMLKLCKEAGATPEELFNYDIDSIKRILAEITDSKDRDSKRVLYLFHTHSLLKDKYSLESEDIFSMLKNHSFITEEERNELKKHMSSNNTKASLATIYKLMWRLKEIILDPEESTAVEDIYYKRHIAAGIPSMYGQYIEPKFESLGLMFRLERTASKLMVQLLQSINLEFITLKTLRRIYGVLELFKEGLELDGISNQGFNSNIDMFKYSLTSPSFSLNQYINLFQFMAQDIRQITSEYFIDAYERPLTDIIPQVFSDYHTMSETEKKQFSQMESEKFFRENLSSAFLVQDLDNFITNIVNTLRNMVEDYSNEFINNVMSYDPDLILSPLNKETLEMDNPVFLGAKAYFLKKLISYGFQVPPGFVLTTEVFRHKDTVIQHPYMNQDLNQKIRKAVMEIERMTSLKFGNPNRPLLFSIRSGSSFSLPGAMKTFLNVGMNDEIAEALSKRPGYEWAAWDCYRRFFQSWGMFYGIERDVFDEIMNEHKSDYGLELKKQFSPEQMRETCYSYGKVLKEHGIYIENEPFQQLRQSILGVMDSWATKSAEYYRDRMQIADEWGTAVIVQKMILGNLSLNSGTGVVFTNSPFNGKSGINLYGDFALCSQGEDVVSGLVNTLPITESQRKQYYTDAEISLESAFPEIYNELLLIARQLIENQGYTHQEIEFTFESNKPESLYILQIRNQNLKKQNVISTFATTKDKMKFVGSGIGISGGALSGTLVFDMDDINKIKQHNPEERIILVRPDTVPDDIPLIFNCDGLITAKGGATSHAAVTAASLGKVCVVSCKSLKVNDDKKTCTFHDHSFSVGDKISIDGKSGFIYDGVYEISFV
ncbi:MAG: PEP/pyruvate-binding domain-containing protein [Anaerovoracaceae bacterium]